jgi:hypothetical protein
VESHISRKTSEMWGTHIRWSGNGAKMYRWCGASGDLALQRTRVPHISLVFREMWD